jgi:hypothetical protein
MEFSRWHRRAGVTTVQAVLIVAGLVGLLGLAACGEGGGIAGDSTARPSLSRPPASEVESPPVADTPTDRPTRGDRTPRDEPTRTQPPRTDPPDETQPPPTQGGEAPPPTQGGAVPAPTQPPAQTEPAETEPTPPPSPPAAAPTASAAAGEDSGLGTLGWILLIGLVAVAIAGLVIWRSRRAAAWDAEAAALVADTRAATTTRLPGVLTATTAAQRGLSWPPLRADLIELVRRWDLLTERASGEWRRGRARQVSELVQNLGAAVDAENDAMAAGRDWTLLRPRVIGADQALSAALAEQAPPDQTPAGPGSSQPGQPPPRPAQPAPGAHRAPDPEPPGFPT